MLNLSVVHLSVEIVKMSDGNLSVIIPKGFLLNKTDTDLAAVELFKLYPDPLLRFASACCVMFMLIGIPGNIVSIIALAKCKKVSEL